MTNRTLTFFIHVAAAFLLYAGTFGHQWTYDDIAVIVENPDVRSLANFVENRVQGRPLRELSALLDHSLFGLEPAGYRVQNILWHALNAFLLFALVLRLGAERPAAWAASFLFLCHPVNVEVVALVSHRKDSLSLAFCLAALLAYDRFVSSSPRRWGWLAAAAGAWGVALLAKQNALVLPVILVVWELALVAPERRFLARSPRLLAGVTGLAGAAVAVWYARLLSGDEFAASVRGAMAKMESYADWTAGAYFRTVLKGWSFSLGKLVLPLDLAPEYTFPVPATWLDPWIGATLALVCAAGWLAWHTFRRHPAAFFALAWAAIFWLPTSNIAGHTAYFAADRYLYAPGAGLCILAALPFGRLFRVRPAAAATLLAVALSCLSLLAWRQSAAWESPRALFSQVLRVSPQSLVGLVGLATDHLERGELDRAQLLLERALRRSPTDPVVLTNIGTIRYRKGDLPEALSYFRRAVDSRPDYVEAHVNIGVLYDDLGETARAREAFDRALALNPHDEKAWTNLGILHERSGRLQEAEAAHRRAIAEKPGYGEAHYNLGVVLFRQGRLPETLPAFESAARLMPDNPDALLNLGITRTRLGDRDGAAALLPILRRLSPEAAGRLGEALSKKQGPRTGDQGPGKP